MKVNSAADGTGQALPVDPSHRVNLGTVRLR